MIKHCATSGCNNNSRKRKLCGTCRSRLLKKNHPHTYFLNALRNNARRRGIEFSLTLADFKEFCFETEYLTRKGTSLKALTVDRIRDNEGYVKGNLQALPQRENCVKKRVVYDHFADKKYSVRTLNKFVTPPTSNFNDAPF